MLEEKKKAKAEESKEIEECQKQGIEHPKVILAKGRAALIEKLLKSSEAKPSLVTRVQDSGTEQHLRLADDVSVDSGCLVATIDSGSSR